MNSSPKKLPGVIPWWTINGHFTEDEARRQLEDFLAKGVTEFFLYPNFGLESPDFLTEEWFAFIAFLLRECPLRGMRFWLYDDLSWPSGASGGRLCRDYPQFRMRTMRRTERLLAPGEIWSPDDAKDYLWCGTFTAGSPNPTPILTDVTYVNLTSSPQRLVILETVLIEDKFFCSMGTSGTWNQPGILDALNPEAVRAWMSYNYEPYRQRFPEALGKTIVGFFFDEPTMVSPFHTGDCPWTPGLFEAFSEKYGYDCMPFLWTLFEQSTDALQFRYDFWRLVAHRFADSFTGQLNKFCEANGLLLSGHCWPEEPSCQRLMTTATGDIHLLQNYLHVPGTDFLYCENNFAEKAGMCPGTPKWARNLIYSAKHPSSTARYNGATDTICECSGICELGPDGTPPSQQKIVFDFLYAMGISIMNPARPYSMTDFRKHVCALDAAQPYWKYYATLAEYMNRMAAFNSRGRTDTGIAILNPLSTKFAYSDICPDTSIRKETTPLPKEGDCSEAMLATLDALVRQHRDFELLFEEVILKSEISDNGELLAPNSAFTVIILPQCHALDDAVWMRLQEFSAKGGTLITIGDGPTIPLKHGGSPMQTTPLAAIPLAPEAKDFPQRLADTLAEALPPRYTIQGENADQVLSHLRSEGAWSALFLTNATPGEKTLTLSGPFVTQAQSVITQDGVKHAWPQSTPSGAPIHLLEGESLLITTDAPNADSPIYGRTQTSIQELPQAGWKILVPPRNSTLLKLALLQNGDFAQLLNDDGASSIRLDPEELHSITIQANFGIQSAIPNDLRLWLDQPGFENLLVNGTPVTDWHHETLVDPENIVIPIAKHCRLGQNRLEITLPLSKWLTERYGIRTHFNMLMDGIEPPILLGDFIVLDDNTIAPSPAHLSCGPLESQGFPQFADTLRLEMTFDCTVPDQPTALAIKDTLLPLDAFLNGLHLGPRIWQNGTIAIPPGALMTTGNRLELRLCGDVFNLLRRRWLGNTVSHVPFRLPKVTLVK